MPKVEVYCPECIKCGRKPQMLGKMEDWGDKGFLVLWCKKCRKEIRIPVANLPQKI